MSGKKTALIIIVMILVCIILIYLSITAFYKNNPHQPNQQSYGLTPAMAQIIIISNSRY